MDHPFLEGFSPPMAGYDRASFILAFSSNVRLDTFFSIMFWMLEEKNCAVVFLV